MTEDDQLPFGGPSGDQQNRPTLDAGDVAAEAEFASSASDRDDRAAESVEIDCPSARGTDRRAIRAAVDA